MALPKQSAPKYTCILPSDGTEVEYRPFLVKEQKNLLLAQEQDNEKAMFKAVQDLIESVTFGKVKTQSMPVIDMEYLFLKIRSKSVGETANIKVTCTDPKCDGTGEAVVNLDDVEVVGDEPDTKIMISDELGIELRYPRIMDLEKSQGLDPAASTIEMLKNSMVTIFDEEEVYAVADASTNELNEFVESITMTQLEQLTEFFNSIPALEIDVKSNCNTCQRDITTKLRGLNSFF
tara:strand:+ start:976 stop:1677 length:702 start_codon:yes stop_codon:yes gene_type:complete